MALRLMPYYATFYSYKGGVGRTLALVNVAVALAKRGKSVILWEADLEAPGLLEMPFFAGLREKAKGGVIDLLADTESDAGRALERYLLVHPKFEQARLRILPAGKPGVGYAKRYNQVRWDDLFGGESTLGSHRFEQIRAGLDSFQPDFVLVDSRTGITDIGGICTVQLPDAVMLVYRLGRQDAAGLRDIYAALGNTERLKKIRKEPLKLLLAATMIPDGFPELTGERMQAVEGLGKAGELRAHFRIPLVPKLLLQEEVWTDEFPDEAVSQVYDQMARDLMELAEGKRAQRTRESREDELAEERLGERRRDKGSAFEDKVAKVLRLLGFEVQTNVSIAGRQVDFLAVQKDPLRETRFLGECKDHLAAQGVEAIDSLHARVCAYQREYPGAQGLLISRNGFTDTAAAHARSLGITLRRYDELMDGLVELGNYVAGLVHDVQGEEIERLYVEPDVYSEERKEILPLQDHIRQWLLDDGAVQLTLLGDYGTGKSWFTRRLAADLGRRYQQDAVGNRCPIRIDLRTMAKALSLDNLLYEHFKTRVGRPVNAEAVLHLLEEGRFVLIFDAFDEMATQASWEVTVANFRELARAAQGKAKVILTCRTHFFRANAEVEALVEGKGSTLTDDGTALYKEIFGRKGFSVAYLRDFGEAQIQEYLRRAGATGIAGLLDTVGGLREVASRPVLLDMVVKSAPRLENREAVHLATLYEAYTEEWLARADWRTLLDRESRRRLAQNLARRLWERDEARMHHSELRRAVAELLPERVKNLADVDVFEAEVRTASFFTRDAEGNYGFSHRSFLEFFVAQALAREVGEGRANLDMRRLSPAVVEFVLALCSREAMGRAAGGVLAGPYRRRASENALLLYVQGGLEKPAEMHLEGAELAGFPLAGADLRGARLDGADLTNAELRGARLGGASLREAELVEAGLEGVDAEGADCSGARLMGARLEGADLRGARFADADLRFVLAVGARRDEAEWAGAQLMGAAFARPAGGGQAVGQGFGSVGPVAYHPGGGLVAFGSGREILIADEYTGVIRRRLRGHGGAVRSVAWRGDGLWLASGSDDRTVRVWEAESGRLVRPLEGHGDGVGGVAWRGDGARLASGSRDNTVRVWDGESGRLLRTLEGHTGWVQSVAWRGDGARLASGSKDSTVRVWEAESGRLLRTVEGHGGAVWSVAWRGDGARLASG
ncbi:MAG: pentapeptide repeat-containing protein, partial [Acidobacteriaceae bacterium]|nr:pentapeptide repeat-containing protein [Acidobacteriaceae bacterium]